LFCMKNKTLDLGLDETQNEILQKEMSALK